MICSCHTHEASSLCEPLSTHTTVLQGEGPRAACSQVATPSECSVLLLKTLRFHVLLVLGVSAVTSALVKEQQPHPLLN